MAERLKDRVALVVGAGSSGPGWGNGKAAAVLYAREGARVFCVDRNVAAAEETAGIGGNETSDRGVIESRTAVIESELGNKLTAGVENATGRLIAEE